jgi:hypothetical protein
VEWLGELSESFPVLQGVRQEEILSTHPDPDPKGRMQLTLLEKAPGKETPTIFSENKQQFSSLCRLFISTHNPRWQE